MKNITAILTMFLCLNIFTFTSGQDSLWVRNYEFGAFNQYDLRTSSSNGITAHRILLDGFRNGIKPRMGKKIGNISYDVFSFATTYMTMLWSHEFGHSLRAKQVGGYFKIHNANLPIPYTTMHLPEDVNLANEALSVTGGFEVNYLNVRKIQNEFIAHNGTFNEDLGFAFANRLMYPLYSSLIVRIDPSEADNWIHTAGDPVHCALPVFKNFSNNQVFIEDDIVNPELVDFYNQSVIFGTFFQLLDPHFYSEVSASFGKKEKVRRPKFLIGSHENGWTYGTLFNVSPLGYELYLNNYLHLKGNQFAIYAKYGKPFKNYGIGVTWRNFIKSDNFNISANVDLWNQDIFGKGMSGELAMGYRIAERIDIKATIAYKSQGYVLGKQLDSGINMGLGFIYFANY